MFTRKSTSSMPARSWKRAGIGLFFNMAKITGHGEDADPLLQADGEGRAVLGVFDGLGGSGSVRCGGADGIQSGAYYGARVARDTAAAALRTLAPFPDATPAAIAHVIGAQLHDALRAYHEEWGGVGSSALRSSLFRRLPTTAAITIAHARGDVARTAVLWAGDSRCYALAPDTGLQQLTVDHLRTREDALANLTSDAAISRCISADGPAVLDSAEIDLPLPTVLIAATDGCFGYLPTPMHFEALLLETMAAASSRDQWLDLLRTRITAVAGDDASLAIVAMGWQKHGALRKAFRPRLRTLMTTYIDPLDRVDDPETIRRTLWAQYADTYEIYLRPQEAPCTT